MNIRKASNEDVKEIVRVHVDSILSSHKGILPQDFLNNLNYEYSIPRFNEALSNPKKT